MTSIDLGGLPKRSVPAEIEWSVEQLGSMKKLADAFGDDIGKAAATTFAAVINEMILKSMQEAQAKHFRIQSELTATFNAAEVERRREELEAKPASMSIEEFDQAFTAAQAERRKTFMAASKRLEQKKPNYLEHGRWKKI